MNNFFFTIDYTNSGHDDSTLEPEDNTNPPQKRNLRKRATTAGMLSRKTFYAAIYITLTNVFCRISCRQEIKTSQENSKREKIPLMV